MLYILLLFAICNYLTHGFYISNYKSNHFNNKNNMKIFQSSSSNPNQIVIITSNKVPRDLFFKSILPFGISSNNNFEIFDIKNMKEMDKKQINDIMINKKSIYMMFEEDGSLTDFSEHMRMLCTYTFFVPTINQKLSYQSTTFLISSCKQRLEKLLLPSLSSNNNNQKSCEVLLQAGDWSHFLSLTFKDVELAIPILPQLRIGIDAVELRVDLLNDISPLSVHRQITLLKDFLQLPIVFTVRTRSQIGKFPDDAVHEIKTLLLEGMRAGVEWIDIEGCLPKEIIHELTDQAKKYYEPTSKLLGSLHITTPQSLEQIQDMFDKCDLDGRADMLKVVTGAESLIDCHNVHTIGAKQRKPYIGLCLGEKGSYSRVLNRRFTPVTHELMAAAAPGQLTVKQLMDIRQKDGLCTPKKFYLFGTPIQHSLSPAMHNNAYQALLLPHKYSLCEEKDVNSYLPILSDRDTSFGGASVTIPHKETIMPMLDEVRGAAISIGAVNTIVVETNPINNKRQLIGYNTDWVGMQRPIKRILNQQVIENNMKKRIGLVIGAGGTARAACYAIKDLGLDLYITNRTPEKAQELADQFHGTFIDIDNLNQLINNNNNNNNNNEMNLELSVVISTVPATANFKLPNEMLIESKPIILDVVYKPAKTSLIDQAIEYNCPFIQGATMLLEQGIEQFELWNHRTAPRVEMTKAIFSDVKQLN